MALVNYTSASEASDSDSEPGGDSGGDHAVASSSSGPAAKKRKTAHPRGDSDDAGAITSSSSSSSASSLPPLPAAFHDLYASTVRPSNVDDPLLHQGRRRQIPHVVGQWPSHLYIEWRPAGPEHAVLTALVDGVAARWRELQQHPHGHRHDDDDAKQQQQPPPPRRPQPRGRGSMSPGSSCDAAAAAAAGSAGGGETSTAITTFLTSDLGAPQPLHISLSRPLSLATAQKDGFLAQLQRVLASLNLNMGGNGRRRGAGGGGGAAFVLRPTALEWHRTYESSRSFLVLRVQAEGALAAEAEAKEEKRGEEEEEEGKGETANPQRRGESTGGKNPELSTLLDQCNRLCRAYKQAELYAFASSTREGEEGAGRATTATTTASSTDTIAAVGDAFHVSLAWTFAAPTAALRQATEEVFARHAGCVRAMSLPVDGVKAKIGNVVTHIGLSSSSSSNGGDKDGGRESSTKRTFGLF